MTSPSIVGKLRSTLFLATRELARQPWRALLGLLVASFVVALMITFQGFRVGIYQDLARFPAGLPADFIILEKGVRNLSLARSVLPQSARTELEAIDGIQSAHPLASIPVILNARDRMTPIQLIVFEDSGGPRQLVQGGPPQTIPGHGIVMDHRLASFLGYTPGDTITLFNYDFTITGTSAETVSPFAPYVYLTYDGLLDMYFSQDKSVSPDAMIFLSALLVRLSPGVDNLPSAIFDKYEVLTPTQLGAADRLVGERMLGPALNVLVAIGFLITTLALGLLMYATALGRSREYGVQRALGVPVAWLMAQLTLEGILLVLLALPLAVLIGAGIGELMLQVSPLYRLELLDADVLLPAALVSMLAGLAGSFIPLHQVAATEPAIVFRGADV